MTFDTALTRDLGLTVPVIQGGMQWVGTPVLASAVSNAGGLGIITALTQPSPAALGEAVKKAHAMLRPGVSKRSKYGGLGVNITLLPSITPPDYEGYARAALKAGVLIFETAGNNPGPIIKLLKEHGAYVVHKCTTVRHALSAQKLGVDMLSIDGFECAGHPGEDDIGGLVLMARAYEDLKIPFVSSGGIANGQGLAASLALGAQGANMGTRFMCTTEAEIHQNVKDVMVKSDEKNTIHIFRTLKNTARVFKNKVALEVVEKESRGAKFAEIQPLVSGQRGKKVYEDGDIDAGIWTCGISVGLIHDIPSCDELVKKIGSDAEEHINRMARICASTISSKQSREAHL
ncbi:hypothetical protein CBS101457_003975 [Exobasidium rhododendri]|nr:hypothetical protein CBS101457_003975 [Exobasidium rhododendri]